MGEPGLFTIYNIYIYLIIFTWFSPFSSLINWLNLYGRLHIPSSTLSMSPIAGVAPFCMEALWDDADKRPAIDFREHQNGFMLSGEITQ